MIVCPHMCGGTYGRKTTCGERFRQWEVDVSGWMGLD